MLAALLSACSFGERPSRALHEAQATVTMADSLRAAGLMYNDSAQLAQAYAVLSKWQWIYPDEYVQACYHYGRLLREKDDPAAAMECFIHATHTRSRNYHILGRVYSNMGDISHLADDFQLSYDMFEHSANMYALAEDSMTYYYALYRMAYEKAELKDSTSCLLLLHEIPDIQELHEYVAMTLAEMYLRCCQYESAIHMANYLQSIGNHYALGYVQKAQALWYSGQCDSAIYYAKYVMSLQNASDQDKYNVLYIIIYGDSTLHADEIKQLSEKRADIGSQILIPRHERIAVATNLLYQDLKKRPLYVYVITCCLIVFLLFCMLWLYGKNIRKAKHQQQEILQKVNQQQSSHLQYKQNEIEKTCLAIRNAKNWQNEICWKDYNQLCEFIDKNFFFFVHKLCEKHILNEKEIRLCILVLIGGFSDKKMADILCYGEKSIRGMKRYTAKKLSTNSANLRVFLLNMLLGASLKQ